MSAAQKEKWAEIVRRYQAGEPMNEIAEHLNVDRKTVYNVARRAGLPRRYRIDPDRRARILSAYAAGEPIKEIARSEGVHYSYVGLVARRAGLPPRKGWQRRYPLDEHAFDHPSSVGWWLIGLLAADGSISRHSNLISLTQRQADADVLHAFLAYVGCPERPLTVLKLSPEASRRAWPRSSACEARVWSAQIRQALAQHGLTETKTKTLRFSREAAENPAVWLGLLDGDGWVSAVGQRGRPRIDFYGTPEVMKQCSAFWGARLTFQRSSAPAVNKHRGGLGRVGLYGENAIRGAQILLASSPVSLQRKRRILEAIALDNAERPE